MSVKPQDIARIQRNRDSAPHPKTIKPMGKLSVSKNNPNTRLAMTPTEEITPKIMNPMP